MPAPHDLVSTAPDSGAAVTSEPTALVMGRPSGSEGALLEEADRVAHAIARDVVESYNSCSIFVGDDRDVEYLAVLVRIRLARFVQCVARAVDIHDARADFASAGMDDAIADRDRAERERAHAVMEMVTLRRERDEAIALAKQLATKVIR